MKVSLGTGVSILLIVFGVGGAVARFEYRMNAQEATSQAQTKAIVALTDSLGAQNLRVAVLTDAVDHIEHPRLAGPVLPVRADEWPEGYPRPHRRGRQSGVATGTATE